ncbi:FMN reductase [Arthrobacter psychrochitiniphilus]|uniref:NADPH-dependent FMN reductase n=1 Tax=Arthrobacter psychrochitiniphilus TaxID=291045 RepID=A0A2V3E2N6_9MICC|nr:FMN reductase [Arthrobacter psychrochitiniphilus]PXA69484.1 NADPH-dependent FMN reductase [Arthrobacter psychrochitiniphilus]
MKQGVDVQRTVVVISAGLGVPSSTRMLADQLAAEVRSRVSAAGAEPVIDVIDLRDYATDIANNMVTGYAGPTLAEVIARVEAADAMIAVTPTFSASYSGLFKSFFDILDPKLLDGMPVLFGATGGSSRHSLVLDMAIRPLFSYLRANTMPTAIYASPEDWGGSGTDPLEQRIGRGAAELVAVLLGEEHRAGNPDHKAKRAQRQMSEASSLPFEELLAQTQRR